MSIKLFPFFYSEKANATLSPLEELDRQASRKEIKNQVTHTLAKEIFDDYRKSHFLPLPLWFFSLSKWVFSHLSCFEQPTFLKIHNVYQNILSKTQLTKEKVPNTNQKQAAAPKEKVPVTVKTQPPPTTKHDAVLVCLYSAWSFFETKMNFQNPKGILFGLYVGTAYQKNVKFSESATLDTRLKRTKLSQHLEVKNTTVASIQDSSRKQAFLLESKDLHLLLLKSDDNQYALLNPLKTDEQGKHQLLVGKSVDEIQKISNGEYSWESFTIIEIVYKDKSYENF